MQYSVIIPAHNESANIERQVTRFIQDLPRELAETLLEILIVENGSTDNTLDACRRLEQTFPNLVRICTLSKGSYGEAIKLGMLESRGTHLSILEADLLDVTFVLKSIAVFRSERAELIVGSKRHPKSVDRRPLKRRALTALYNVIFLRLFLDYPGTDTHGLKSIETNCAKRLCRTALSSDEVFQTEIVLLAWRLGICIKEIPISILEMRITPVSILRRIPKVLSTVRVLKYSLGRFPSEVLEVDGASMDHLRLPRKVETQSEKSGVW
jgi:glycosyltransferase involved in cell wall biosynthesis